MRVGLAGCSGAVTAGRTGQVHGYCVCVRAVELNRLVQDVVADSETTGVACTL